MVMLNIISYSQNRFVMIRDGYSETLLKEFIVNVFTDDGLNCKGLYIPNSKTDIGICNMPTLNIVLGNRVIDSAVGHYFLTIEDDARSFDHIYLTKSCIIRLVDKYWYSIENFIINHL